MEERVRNLRYRAEELRAIAEEFKDEGTQRSLNRVADDYERMADVRENALGMKDGQLPH